MYQLERLLPPRDDVMITDDMEEVDLCEADVRSQQKNYGREAYEEDDESPRGGVQCQTQWSKSVIYKCCRACGSFCLTWISDSTGTDFCQVEYSFYPALPSLSKLSFVVSVLSVLYLKSVSFKCTCFLRNQWHKWVNFSQTCMLSVKVIFNMTDINVISQ